MKQWHPPFIKLLRPLVESHYAVETNMPVGDVPREADLVLLRRTVGGALPFQGLWKNLTTWNVLEFKGPTVSPRLGDLDRLIELGLGIDRRLNQERTKQRKRPLAPEEMSFWYLVNQLSRRWLQRAEQRLGPLETVGSGLWRCKVLQRLVYLVSSADLPVEEESLPLHILAKEAPQTSWRWRPSWCNGRSCGNLTAAGW